VAILASPNIADDGYITFVTINALFQDIFQINVMKDIFRIHILRVIALSECHCIVEFEGRHLSGCTN